jgi:AraC-like DNA-binding protein
VPSLTINGFGCFKEAFEYKAMTNEDSYLLILCDFGEGFYLHNGKNGVIRQGQYMIVKESDGFACSIYLPAESMMIHVLSFYYRVPYTITTKHPEIILTDIKSRVYGGWNIFMRACNILSNENAVDNLPYASALLLSFIEAERYVKNEGVDAGSAKSELVEKAIQYMYDNIQKDVSIADLLKHLGCSRSKLFRHFRDYKTARPLEFLNEIRIKRACKLLTDTSLHINEICKEVGINNHVYFSRLFTKTIGMSPTEYRKVNRTK